MWPSAAELIRESGLTVAEYQEHCGYDSADVWPGDKCGCPDDRCIGHHHGELEECGCVEMLIEEALAAR